MRTIIEKNSENLVIMDVFSKLIQNRSIFIDDVITPELANETVAQLLYLDAIDTGEPIKLYINSPGGLVSQGLAIYDTIQLLNSPVVTIGLGEVASMATILLIAGSVRKATKNTRIMLHEVSSGYRGKLTDLKIDLAETELVNNILMDIIEEKTNIKNARELFIRDKWIGVNEALELGILTEIL